MIRFRFRHIQKGCRKLTIQGFIWFHNKHISSCFIFLSHVETREAETILCAVCAYINLSVVSQAFAARLRYHRSTHLLTSTIAELASLDSQLKLWWSYNEERFQNLRTRPGCNFCTTLLTTLRTHHVHVHMTSCESQFRFKQYIYIYIVWSWVRGPKNKTKTLFISIHLFLLHLTCVYLRNWQSQPRRPVSSTGNSRAVTCPWLSQLLLWVLFTIFTCIPQMAIAIAHLTKVPPVGSICYSHSKPYNTHMSMYSKNSKISH